MNIVFIGLASTFTPGMTYQDNLLCTQTVADGHQVTYISNPEKFVDGNIVDTEREDTILSDGMRLIRLPYCRIGTDRLTKKIRKFRGVYDILEQIQPDVIFCHNTQYYSILDVIRYKQRHSSVILYADTHTDTNNSGTNWLSLHILHRIYYRWLTQKLLPYLEKYFYVTAEGQAFSIQNYGVPAELTEHYPLGGFLPAEEDAARWRLVHRKELEMADGELLLLHSGKLGSLKRTAELLRAFAAVPELQAKLAIIGAIPPEMESTLRPLIEADRRVRFLGWKSGAELQEFLCACDLYCQPGSQSATMQNAICCGKPLLLYPHMAYTTHYEYGNIFWVKDQNAMIQAFQALADGSADLSAMSAGSQRCARELLDYRKLAARLYR